VKTRDLAKLNNNSIPIARSKKPRAITESLSATGENRLDEVRVIRTSDVLEPGKI
jgi:hypothetical protein